MLYEIQSILFSNFHTVILEGPWHDDWESHCKKLISKIIMERRRIKESQLLDLLTKRLESQEHQQVFPSTFILDGESYDSSMSEEAYQKLLKLKSFWGR